MNNDTCLKDAAGRDVIERVVMQSTALDETDAPARVLVAPWGEVRSTVGAFVLDEEAAARTIASFAAHGTDVPVDYEHQTLGGSFSAPNGQAPAAGWIKALIAVPPAQAGRAGMPEQPGLWAEVVWTEQARAQLRNRQYRYLSPVALVRREDGRMIGLHSVALTNKPAIVGMRPLVNRAADREQRRAALVAAGSTVALAPIEAVAAPPPPAAERPPGEVSILPVAASGDAPVIDDLRSLLGLDESASEDVIMLAAVERVRGLEREAAGRRAEERVARAAAAGKLTAPQRAWALDLALRDPRGFDAWERVAPLVAPLGRTSAPAFPADAGSARRGSIEAAARSEYRANRELLERLCAEEAFVADSLRQAGF